MKKEKPIQYFQIFFIQILIVKIIMTTDYYYMLHQTLKDIISINPLRSHAEQC